MRGKRAPKREQKADPTYRSVLVGQLINKVMRDGKKSLAQKAVYDSFEKIKSSTKKEPLEVFKEALVNVQPAVELRSRRVGGANYQVPIPVSKERSTALAIRWIVDAARNRKGKPMTDRLTQEILSAIKNEGEAIQKKETTHKMAEANKAFAIFRW